MKYWIPALASLGAATAASAAPPAPESPLVLRVELPKRRFVLGEPVFAHAQAKVGTRGLAVSQILFRAGPLSSAGKPECPEFAFQNSGAALATREDLTFWNDLGQPGEFTVTVRCLYRDHNGTRGESRATAAFSVAEPTGVDADAYRWIADRFRTLPADPKAPPPEKRTIRAGVLFYMEARVAAEFVQKHPDSVYAPYARFYPVRYWLENSGLDAEDLKRHRELAATLGSAEALRQIWLARVERLLDSADRVIAADRSFGLHDPARLCRAKLRLKRGDADAKALLEALATDSAETAEGLEARRLLTNAESPPAADAERNR